MFTLKLDLELLQQADCDKVDMHGRHYYTATAVDKKGNVYLIEWVSTENWDELIEAGIEDDVCDWQVPYTIRLIEKAEDNKE